MTHRTLFFLAALSLVACQGDSSDDSVEPDGSSGGSPDDDPCGACAPGGYAVDCGYLWGLGEFPNSVCGINQANAEYLCESTFAGVVLSSPSDKCGGLSEPWDPSLNIYPGAAEAGVTIIELGLLDRIEDHPEDLYLDATRLDWSVSGGIFVSTEGELSSALGLQADDVLIDVNGYSFSNMLETPRLYSTLRSAEILRLTLERDEVAMTINYLIR